MFLPWPVSLLQLGVFWTITVLLVSAVGWIALRNRRHREAAAKRMRSTIGVALQSLACAAAGFGSSRLTLPWWSTSSLVSATAVVLLGGGAIALFLAAASTMGKNWSLVARTRGDHELVRSGPFAWVRHPIYLALLLYLFSIAIGLGHYAQLAIAVPLFLAGTIIRIRDEERLLRAQFGEAHARYVREVPALIPKIV